ncbi:MAG: flagellar biosynthetic protein FliO [Oscillospiraceae bacterium]|nr:flagellar biosynthetic protein FliO [Oscillospiraceae bacterium]
MGESAIGSVFSVLAAVLVFIIILYLAYISTKLIGKRYGRPSANGKNLRIIESMPAGPDKYLMIIRAGQKYLLVGSGKEHLEYICDLDSDELNLESSSDKSSGGDFYEILKEAAKERIGTIKNRGDKYKNSSDSK